MIKNNKDSSNNYNFLHDDNFIMWRLFRTIELDEYWEVFMANNPDLENSILESIAQFEAVKINKDRLLLEKDKKNIYRTVLQKIYRHERRLLARRVISVVAFFAIAALSILYFSHINETGQEYNLISNEIIIGEALPEEEIYLVSGDEKIIIDHNSRIALGGDGKVMVRDSNEFINELIFATNEINKLVVPYGKRTSITLTDGTEVWLNSGTQLDFTTDFIGDKREIRVNGEIFINVTPDAKRPFEIYAPDINIQVEGTSFNLSAYRNDNKKTIVLVNGKVTVNPANHPATKLLPNEKLEITSDETTKELVNVSQYISWTKGILEFNETPISEVLKRIGRYYNVQFESSPETTLNDQTFSGKLFLSNNLDSVMTSVSILSSTIYKRENNIIHITKK